MSNEMNNKHKFSEQAGKLKTIFPVYSKNVNTVISENRSKSK